MGWSLVGIHWPTGCSTVVLLVKRSHIKPLWAISNFPSHITAAWQKSSHTLI
jgi:hypothetical protein